mgnify:CR=1 FL=1
MMGRPRLGPQKRVPVQVYLRGHERKLIDAARGKLSRSAWLAQAGVEAALAALRPAPAEVGHDDPATVPLTCEQEALS